MELKGSRTEQNLMAAFSGESMARNKYLFFADKARQEGHPEVAELFEQMAQNEGIHGKLLYQKLKGVGSSAANLQEAIQGEYGEWSSMYPSFADIAREEGFEAIGTLFDQISKIEKDHEFRFLTALAKLSASGKTVNSEIRFIGVPKTIDNDLMLTDHTPGYGSAAKYIATILKEVICDSSVYDLRSVTVAEIMGRHTGWLAAAASLAAGPDCNGPDLILLPECPFDEEAFLKRVAELEKERHNVIIAVSEGVKNKDGVFLCDLVSTAGQLDAFGHKAILSGTSRYLADLIRVRLGCKTRAIEFSTLQRCASHLASRTDVTEAYQVGGAAVEAAMRGETAKMAAIKRLSDQPYRVETEMVDVTKVANFEKKVPADWITEDGMHVNEKFERYARPLIQAELSPIYINGVPRHIHL